MDTRCWRTPFTSATARAQVPWSRRGSFSATRSLGVGFVIACSVMAPECPKRTQRIKDKTPQRYAASCEEYSTPELITGGERLPNLLRELIIDRGLEQLAFEWLERRNECAAIAGRSCDEQRRPARLQRCAHLLHESLIDALVGPLADQRAPGRSEDEAPNR